MAHPVVQLIPVKSLGMLLLTASAFFAAVVLTSHAYLSSLDEEEDVYRFVEKHRFHQASLQAMRSVRGMSRRPAATNKQSFNFHGQNHVASEMKQRYDEAYPPDDLERAREFVKTLRRPYEYQTQLNLPYDIYNCPSVPPMGYPFAWNVMDVLNHWNPRNTTEPARLHQSICVFDYERDLATAEIYRQAEVPFLMRNTPTILLTSERWNRGDYLSQLLGNTLEKVEHSQNNHFMYFKLLPRLPAGWKPPMENVKLSYTEWLDKANQVTTDEPNQERFYFRLNGVMDGPHGFLYNELPIFKPNAAHNFFMVDSEEERGINCRFGMKGVIAETHYDQSRNFITLLGGQRRYILAHPKECPNLGLYPIGHPSGRHSALDWTNPDVAQFPKFALAQVQEVVLQAGDALYLPTDWFHFIVSLNINYQCNARSGTTHEHDATMQACGFV